VSKFSLKKSKKKYLAGIRAAKENIYKIIWQVNRYFLIQQELLKINLLMPICKIKLTGRALHRVNTFGIFEIF
jgi:hypothetical protein